MSHCWLYGENFKVCVEYPTFCDNRCWFYIPPSGAEVGEALKKLLKRLEEEQKLSERLEEEENGNS